MKFKRKMNRLELEKKIIIAVILIAGIVLVVSVALNLWNIRRMHEIISDQFNGQQLAVARSISRSIESELGHIKREALILKRTVDATPAGLQDQHANIRKSFTHIMESGVQKIEILDFGTQKIYTYLPHGSMTESDSQKNIGEFSDLLENPDDENISVSQPVVTGSQINIALYVALKSGSPSVLVFHTNISWLLSPLITDVRSGKTGYAWVIDNNGLFMYHPLADFIGENAFTVRKEKQSNISFVQINAIQKEKMIKGEEGTGWYVTGWHRGNYGEMKKLIAYCPIEISDNPPQVWSVAVVAPESETEGAIMKGIISQFLILGFVVTTIMLSAAAILFFEVRWSRLLETKVADRTEELIKSEEKYRSLIESAEDFIYTLDADANFLSMNSYTANFFGGRAEDFIGKRLSTVLPANPVGRQLKMVHLVLEHGKSLKNEFQLQVGSHTIWLSANYMPLRDNDGKIFAVLCIARDITEQKNLERQLISTEKLASIGMLAAGVAHEINNPVGVILGFCDILLRKTRKDSQDYEDLKTIERQANHCKEFVESLLSFARMEEEKTVHSDLNQCLNDIIKVAKHTYEKKDIVLTITMEEWLPSVKADHRQLQQVFLNLINNAVSAMDKGGHLLIRSGLDISGRYVVVDFKDDGTGIKETDIENIFEPFFTTKPEGEGTGLGLFVSYGIISKYGGTIECVSSTGDNPDRPKGTTFTVKIPVDER